MGVPKKLKREQKCGFCNELLFPYVTSNRKALETKKYHRACTKLARDRRRKIRAKLSKSKNGVNKNEI